MFLLCIRVLNFYIKNKKTSLTHALCLSLLVLAVYSNDFILWRSFFFPFFLLALISQSSFFVKFLSTLIWGLTAGSLSFIGALVAFVLSKGRDFYVLIIALLATFFSAKVDLLDYPKNALLVALKVDKLADIFGLHPKYNFINSSVYSELSVVFLFAALIPLSIYLFLFLKNKSYQDSYKYTVLILILFFNYVYLILYKFIPGVSLLPLSWDLYLILLTSFLFLCINFIKEPPLYAFVVLLPLCLFFAYNNQQSSLESNLDCIKNFTNQNTPSNFASNYWKDIKEQEYNKIENFELINPVKEILDKDLKTRWSTRGAQVGGEEFVLDFKKQINISKVKLDVGPFTSDFPRGLKVELEDSLGKKTTIFNQPHWIGPIKFTKLGYAYFGHQSDVSIAFGKTYQTKKITFTQTASDKVYDWSIIELELYENKIN